MLLWFVTVNEIDMDYCMYYLISFSFIKPKQDGNCCIHLFLRQIRQHQGWRLTNAAMFQDWVTPGWPQIEFQPAYKCGVNLIWNNQVFFSFFWSPDLIKSEIIWITLQKAVSGTLHFLYVLKCKYCIYKPVTAVACPHFSLNVHCYNTCLF